ncbi:ABC transporter ATP-binding protein [Phenylobacterium sp.]|uniref:ABC transporter ATP-binding protein n=1 Tax=Phenylobacterium sp. TaxID=1871053 RepID=UPI00121CAA18|nr:ABC transporter ATP-binding protein [Phenylobacterium sp.]THD64469.1 MAG: ABC transporter ATP-binding protein [Phenylobacterium sp.]
MARLELTSLTKRYGDFVAVDDFSIAVNEGEFIVFVGPSGCGKTTILRMIAGFVPPTQGAIRIDGADVTAVPPHRRNLGVVFQNYAVFPHLDVFENVAFGLRRRKLPKAEVEARTRRALALVQLDALASRLPNQLSGGQKQRVAIARALAIEPSVLLLDEPLSNLDAKLRLDVRREIHALQRQLGITTIMVTHDQDEALSLADRVVVMSQGRVQQIGAPQAVYRDPANIFVAGFIGRASFLHGRTAGTGAEVAFTTAAGLQLSCRCASEGADTLVIRPESVALHGAPPRGRSGVLSAEVEHLTYLGPVCEVSLRLSGGDLITAAVHADLAVRLSLAPRSRVFAEIARDAAYAIVR